MLLSAFRVSPIALFDQVWQNVEDNCCTSNSRQCNEAMERTCATAPVRLHVAGIRRKADEAGECRREPTSSWLPVPITQTPAGAIPDTLGSTSVTELLGCGHSIDWLSAIDTSKPLVFRFWEKDRFLLDRKNTHFAIYFSI
jgi:hypothetical protein